MMKNRLPLTSKQPLKTWGDKGKLVQEVQLLIKLLGGLIFSKFYELFCLGNCVKHVRLYLNVFEFVEYLFFNSVRVLRQQIVSRMVLREVCIPIEG